MPSRRQGRMFSRRPVVLAAVLAAITVAGCSGAGQATAGQPGTSATGQGATSAGPTFAGLSQRAVRTLEQGYYTGAGTWNTCLPRICGTGNLDWGDDSLTYSLYFHWRLTHDRGVVPIMNALAGTAYRYTPGTSSWSDVPMWDTIADVREYQVTGNPAALAKAEAAFGFVAIEHESDFAFGACPSVFFQQPGGGNRLKTLETGSNYIKAALLLYQVTHRQRYLQLAIAEYSAVRAYFLSPHVPLYTVYVFDSGRACRQVPGRYFGSVNGNMIWAGFWLARATGQGSYLRQALATAHAVQRRLADTAGVYADLQAENDISEPLVEAMYDLATLGHQGFARQLAADRGECRGRRGHPGRRLRPLLRRPATAGAGDRLAGQRRPHGGAGGRGTRPARAAGPAGVLGARHLRPARSGAAPRPGLVHLHRARGRDHRHDRGDLL